jgi:hypothetical protein
MKNDTALTVLSLLAIALFAFHISDDIVRGIEPPTAKHWQGMSILSTWLFVTVGMDHGRWRSVLLLAGGLFASLPPLAHFYYGLSAKTVASDGALFFISCMFFLGIAGPTSVLLAAKALWKSRSRTA